MSIERKLIGTTDAATSSAVYVEDVFSTWLYNGTGSSQTITNGVDLATKGGLIWIKNRNGSSFGNLSNYLQDTARGITFSLSSNDSNQQFNQGTGGVTSVGSSGFAIGNAPGWNDNTYAYASWTFAKQAKFFDVVTYTGNGVAGRQIAHSLGAVPGMIIVKRTDTTGNWQVYHRSLTSAANSIQLNLSAAQASATTVWNSTAPTSSVFSVGTDATVNASGGTYVAYLFADSNSGGFGPAGADSVVACGSFTADGSGNATVSLGWEPQWLLYRDPNAGANWSLEDTMRGAAVTTFGAPKLLANSSSAESGSSRGMQPTSTGFRIEGGAGIVNTTFIYLAIRRGPMRTPTDATKVFAPVAYTGTGSTRTLSTGIVSDLSMFKGRTTGGSSALVLDRLRGGKAELITPYNSAEYAWPSNSIGFDNNSGLNLNGNGVGGMGNYNFSSMVAWNFRRAPGFFDVVCYTGTGAWPLTVSHNLTVAPELIIIKNRSSATDWFVGSVYLPDGWNNPMSQVIVLNSANPAEQQGYIHSADASAFKVVANNFTGASGSNYVAYLFATCPGVSKVGLYTGNGSSQTIDCGFASGARFVLIRATAGGDWYVWDSSRGIVSGNDPRFSLNTDNTEVTTDDSIDPASSGFIVNQLSATNINVSSAKYIYLAIA